MVTRSASRKPKYTALVRLSEYRNLGNGEWIGGLGCLEPRNDNMVAVGFRSAPEPVAERGRAEVRARRATSRNESASRSVDSTSPWRASRRRIVDEGVGQLDRPSVLAQDGQGTGPSSPPRVLRPGPRVPFGGGVRPVKYI